MCQVGSKPLVERGGGHGDPPRANSGSPNGRASIFSSLAPVPPWFQLVAPPVKSRERLLSPSEAARAWLVGDIFVERTDFTGVAALRRVTPPIASGVAVGRDRTKRSLRCSVGGRRAVGVGRDRRGRRTSVRPLRGVPSSQSYHPVTIESPGAFPLQWHASWNREPLRFSTADSRWSVGDRVALRGQRLGLPPTHKLHIAIHNRGARRTVRSR